MEEEEWQLLGTGIVADEEWVLPTIDSDKPGFARWADTLSTREVASVDNACIGKWLPLEQAVELVQQRGKRYSTTGFSQGGLRLLYPEEALFLLDEGGLYLQRPPPKRGWKAAAAASAAAEQSKRQRRELVAAKAVAKIVSVTADAAQLREEGFEAAVPAMAVSGIAVGAVEPASYKSSIAVSTQDNTSNEKSPAPLSWSGATETGSCPPKTLDALPDDGPIKGARFEGSAPAAPHVADTAVASAAEQAPLTRSSVASDLMPLPAAYELLVRHCNMAHFMVYSQLRSAGLVVYRHRAYAHVTSGDAAPPQPEIVDLALPMAGREAVLVPLFDVYARDGITTFKPSAPGAPDFYVIVAECVSAWQCSQALDFEVLHRTPDTIPLLPLRYCRRSVNEAPPTARQVADLQRRLTAHMQAARLAQVLKVGERADVALGPAANTPQIKYAITSHTTITFYSVSDAV